MSPPDLSEAADSMNHFLSLLAGFLTEKKNKTPFARLILTTKDTFYTFFFLVSFFNLNGFNLLQLQYIAIKYWRQELGTKNINRMCVKY